MGDAAARLRSGHRHDDNPAARTSGDPRRCPVRLSDALEIGDRAKAIVAALNDLGPDDVLVVAGRPRAGPGPSPDGATRSDASA